MSLYGKAYFHDLYTCIQCGLEPVAGVRPFVLLIDDHLLSIFIVHKVDGCRGSCQVGDGGGEQTPGLTE